MKKCGVVAIATLGKEGPHLVNTWNRHIRISADGRLFIPAGHMHETEENVAYNPNVRITLGSSKAKGLHGAGAGFLIKGKATFTTSGPDFDCMKAMFSWLRPPRPLPSILLLKAGEDHSENQALQLTCHVCKNPAVQGEKV